MKLPDKATIFLVFFLPIIFFNSCYRQVKEQNVEIDQTEDAEFSKRDYELAADFLLNLKKEMVDTIIYYQRTCIHCCDYYNIFWTNNGQRYLAKFYFDFNDMKTHSKTITLITTEIFEVLANNYTELQNTSIKENTHKRDKEGGYVQGLRSNECYTTINIFTCQDSIIPRVMKDHDFYEFTDFGSEYLEKRETNDNYLENLNSKWNKLALTIEYEISKMVETSQRELENLR